MPQPTEAPSLDLKASLKKPLQWALAAGLLTAGVTLFLPNYYRSEARLLPVEAKGIGGNLGGLASAEPGSCLGNEAFNPVPYPGAPAGDHR